MKRLRLMCIAIVFACALAASARAGDMHAGITETPPLPSTAEANGEIECGVVEALLTLLQNALSAF